MTDTIMHKAMKALTLALVAAAAGRAQADLVVSALFGTEPPSYVHAAVTNVLSFTLPTTKIVLHLSTASLVKPDSFTDQRISINPDRQHTSSATGMVTRQHASNVRYASQHLEFDHVVLFASTCRLLVGGGLLESTIRDFHFSAVMQPPWAQIALLPCDQQRKHPRLRKMGWCSSWLNIAKLFNGKSPKRQDYKGRMAFSMHEGSFFTKEAAVAFSNWLWEETGWGDPRIAASTQFTAHSGVVGEELLWPTWTLSHAKQIGYAPKPGSSFCVHDGRFGSSDLSLAHSLVAYRLGVERRKRGCAPLMCAAARESISRRRRGRAGYAIEEMSR